MNNSVSNDHSVFSVGEDIEKKVQELIGKMTLEEKAGQMQQCIFQITSEELQQNQFFAADSERIENYKKMVREGKVGSFYALAGGPGIVNEMQRIAVEESRLGIPLLNALDALHGFKTIFPIPLAAAAGWDPRIVERASAVIAEEIAAEGFNWIYAPMLDVSREPRWGRIAEGVGEDPFLGSAMARAGTSGLQRNSRGKGPRVAAAAKHFAGYGAVEGGRDYNTVDMSEKTFREVYLPPFKAAVDAGLATIMNGFIDYNGMPISGNSFLLREILREEMGFTGVVVSDYESINELVVHGIAADLKEAAGMAVKAGIDVDLAGGVYSKYLPELVREGKLPEELMDESVSRILRLKFWLGLFDGPYTDTSLRSRVHLTQENLATALEEARKSIVLLKNENNLLPLKKELHKIAVIGPLADSPVDSIGCWAFIEDFNCVSTVLDGIKGKVCEKTEVAYSKGCGVVGNSDEFSKWASTIEAYRGYKVRDDSGEAMEEAIRLAKESDIAVVVVGEAANMTGEGFSRASLDLPSIQEELVKAVHGTGVPVVVVLMNGRPMSIPWIDKNIPAVVEGWHLGIQTGNAIADVLFGDYNPGGKLPATFPRSAGQLPIYYNHKNTGRPADYDKLSSKYLDMPIEPLYPFGYGLSYTKFEYNNLSFSPKKIKTSETVTVSVDVKNTGEREGDEVVQMYVRDVVASMTRPVKELKGFERITLKAGESKTVEFLLTKRELGFYNRNMKFAVEPGLFRVLVGTSSIEGLQGDFEVYCRD